MIGWLAMVIVIVMTPIFVVIQVMMFELAGRIELMVGFTRD